MVDNQANMSKIYQNTTPKTPPPREKAWTFPFLSESPKSKHFQSPHLLLIFNHQNILPIKAFKQTFHITYRKKNLKLNMPFLP